MTLKEDAKGLLYSADLPNTESGREIIELVSRGDIASSSFGFIPVRQRFAEHDGLTVRLLEQVKLMDVSCTRFGAYCGTSVGVVGESSAPGRANPPSGNYPELDHPNPETRKLLMKLRLDAIEDDMLDDERFFHEQAEREWELNEFLSELRVRAAQVKAIELGAELDFDDLETYS